MSYINDSDHKELFGILEELLQTICIMRNNNNDYILAQNESDAREWINYLRDHYDNEELRSLEKDISDRLFFKYDVEIEKSELDNKRVELMKDFIIKSNKLLHS